MDYATHALEIMICEVLGQSPSVEAVDCFVLALLDNMGAYSTSRSGICTPTTARRELIMACLRSLSKDLGVVGPPCSYSIEWNKECEEELAILLGTLNRVSSHRTSHKRLHADFAICRFVSFQRCKPCLKTFIPGQTSRTFDGPPSSRAMESSQQHCAKHIRNIVRFSIALVMIILQVYRARNGAKTVREPQDFKIPNAV